MPLTGNVADDKLIRNFNRLVLGCPDGVYRPNATKVRRAPNQSLTEQTIRNAQNKVDYVYSYL